MNGYTLLNPFQNEDAGFSRWTLATKGEKEYFLKEFLDPIYPIEESLSEKLRLDRIHTCEEYEKIKRKMYESVNNASDGNLVRIIEFFRYDSHYYIATEKIERKKLTMKEVASLPMEDKILLCKSIAHSMMCLHNAGIVHSDIKEGNVLLKETTTGRLIGKIIDFDACFFENNPPDNEDDLGGDQVYLAPESCQFLFGDSIRLNRKIDVFALGLLFHQYLTGEMPGFNTNEYDYAHEAVLDDNDLVLSVELPSELRQLIQNMLSVNPKERPKMETVYDILTNLDFELRSVCVDAGITGQTISKTDTPNLTKNTPDKKFDKYFYQAGDL